MEISKGREKRKEIGLLHSNTGHERARPVRSKHVNLECKYWHAHCRRACQTLLTADKAVQLVPWNTRRRGRVPRLVRASQRHGGASKNDRNDRPRSAPRPPPRNFQPRLIGQEFNAPFPPFSFFLFLVPSLLCVTNIEFREACVRGLQDLLTRCAN